MRLAWCSGVTEIEGVGRLAEKRLILYWMFCYTMNHFPRDCGEPGSYRG